MDDFLAGEVVRGCDLGATGQAAVEGAAFFEEFFPSGAVDGSVDAIVFNNFLGISLFLGGE